MLPHNTHLWWGQTLQHKQPAAGNACGLCRHHSCKCAAWHCIGKCHSSKSRTSRSIKVSRTQLHAHKTGRCNHRLPFQVPVCFVQVLSGTAWCREHTGQGQPGQRTQQGREPSHAWSNSQPENSRRMHVNTQHTKKGAGPIGKVTRVSALLHMHTQWVFKPY